MSSKKGSQDQQKNDGQDNDLFSRINAALDRNKTTYLLVALTLASLFTMLLFDLKINEGGDDSGYIMRAIRLVKNGTYPTYQGPLYPLLLSIPFMIFGLDLVIMKIMSSIFIIGFIYLFYKTYKDLIPNLVLYIALFFTAICGYFLQFGSLTYSEPLYLFIQITVFWFFFKYWIRPEDQPFNLKQDAWKYLVLGALIIVLSLARKPGLFVSLVIGAYFLFQKKWKELAASVVSIGFFYFLYYEVIQYHVLNLDPKSLQGQTDLLLNKNPYNASEGKEDFWGFVGRLVDNTNQYLSYHMYKFLGLRPDMVTSEEKNIGFLTFLTVGLLGGALAYGFKKNKALLFTGLYVFIAMGLTFIVLQARWNQSRLVIIYFPYFIMMVMALIYYLLKTPKRASMQFIGLILPLIFLFTTFGRTWSHSKEQFTSLRKNLKGDIYHGYTPDWENFLRMSEWVGKNIPEDQFVGSRKPTMSAIYAGGREFYGMYRVESENPDTLVDQLIKADVDYIIMASLRKIPNKKTQYTINTVQRFLYYMSQKYPNIAQQVHQIGVSEPAYLFKLNYPPERVKAVQAAQAQGK